MTLSVIYCLDTEGPLREDPHATVMRLIREHGLDERITGAPDTILADVQRGTYGGYLADVAAPHRLAFLQTWDEVESMLADLVSDATRGKYVDSFGTPLRISWFVADLIGYRNNPRQRAQGQHAVYDRVQKYFGPHDSVGWHVHTLTPNRDPLAYGRSWTAVLPAHEESLCRRLLDYGTFPASFRAGGAIQRNDLSHYLERFIPFDFSCLPKADTHGMSWTNAFSYHPAWADYRSPGTMQRTIHPCYDADSWAHRVEALPKTAERFAFSNHDRKAVTPDLDRIVHLLNTSGRDWQWTTASHPSPGPPVLIGHEEPVIVTTEDIFGEPFVAVDDYEHVYRVNTLRESRNSWAYDRPTHVKRIAAAVNTPDGRTGVARA